MCPKREQGLKEHSVFGKHVVQLILENNPESIKSIYLQEKITLEKGLRKCIEQVVTMYGIPLQELSKKALDNMASGGVHQGILMHCLSDTKNKKDEAFLKRWLPQLRNPFFLVLDQVSDPRNFGACLRTAEALGVDAVIVPNANSAPLSAVTRKSSAGATEIVTLIEVGNLARVLRYLKSSSIWVVGADQEGAESIWQTDFTVPTALVMGSEGAGLRHLTKQICDLMVSIPLTGKTPSLNVSVATGIILGEVFRQRVKQ